MSDIPRVAMTFEQLPQQRIHEVVAFPPDYADFYRNKVGELAGLLSEEAMRDEAMTEVVLLFRTGLRLG
jgi:hypothetical protein